MIPILETKSPFVIKIYDSFFHISWDGLSDLNEDKFYYDKVKSIDIQKVEKEDPTLEEGILMTVLAYLLQPGRSHVRSPFYKNKNSEGLVIKFKNGEQEIRYFHDQPSVKYKEAIQLIEAKLSN